MLDLETGGTSAGCAIFSIGAVCFDPMSDFLGDEFYLEVSHKSCIEQNLRFDQATMDWWKAIGNPPNGLFSVSKVLTDFIAWIKANKPLTAYWANSPSFDLSILNYALRINELEFPLPYYSERDVRTLKAIAWPNNEYKLHNGHNALDDAKNQARLVQAAYYTLGLSTNENRTKPQPSRNIWKVDPSPVSN